MWSKFKSLSKNIKNGFHKLVGEYKVTYWASKESWNVKMRFIFFNFLFVSGILAMTESFYKFFGFPLDENMHLYVVGQLAFTWSFIIFYQTYKNLIYGFLREKDPLQTVKNVYTKNQKILDILNIIEEAINDRSISREVYDTEKINHFIKGFFNTKDFIIGYESVFDGKLSSKLMVYNKKTDTHEDVDLNHYAHLDMFLVYTFDIKDYKNIRVEDQKIELNRQLEWVKGRVQNAHQEIEKYSDRQKEIEEKLKELDYFDEEIVEDQEEKNNSKGNKYSSKI